MNVLILGSGGREHALAWKISQSDLLDQLFVAPGNPGTAEIANNVPLEPSDFKAQEEFIKNNDISLLLVGPEAPLVAGISDYFSEKIPNLLVIGPSKSGAELEGSKSVAKQFMNRHQVPTAAYRSFHNQQIKEAHDFLESSKSPYVLKADGLAAGKGVLILNDLAKAKEEVEAMLSGNKFGSSGERLVIEEFLEGIEMSVFVLTDGKDYQLLPSAKDYKRIGEGDRGLNTGGMGAVSPVPFCDEVLQKKIEDKIVKPSIAGLAKDGINYKGFLFIGLMIVNGEPFVIEYNVRMGDPETEVVMPRIESDLLESLIACAKGEMSRSQLELAGHAATTVMLVSEGYPEAYEKGKEIKGMDQTGDCILFHAGTKSEDGKLLTNGGRVMAITATGTNYKDALAKSYRNVDRILYEGKYFRKDIGFDLM